MTDASPIEPSKRGAPRVLPDLCLAGGMAFLAGATDAYGLTMLGGLYVSFMSGNTTMLGASAGAGDGARSAQISGLIALFVAGASFCSIASDLTGRLHTPIVILITSLVLCLPSFEPAWTAPCFVFAMGGLNLAMGKVGAAGVGLTYVTGALVKFGHGLGLWLVGRRTDMSWLIQGALWASILSGACVGKLSMRLGAGRLWELPLLGITLAGFAFVLGPVEPAADFPGEANAQASRAEMNQKGKPWPPSVR